ncbi:MAG: ribosome silencing factor [Candidatus Omnitrophota bacterium]
MTIEPKKKALLAAKLALERKAEDIAVLDMRKSANFCDYFVICSSSSQRRAAAIAELIEEQFKQQGLKLRSLEGKREGLWILLDYSDVVIHIFFKDSRDHYGLDRLWQDAKRVDVSTARKTTRLSARKKR